MTLNELQLYSDQICDHFRMEKIPIIVNNRFKRLLGRWTGSRLIELNPKTGMDLTTLRHELAHHLRYHRFEKRVLGYFKMEMWPKMVLDSIDENGKKWYAAKGELNPVYMILGTSHGKQFKECIRNIMAFDLIK